MLVRCSQVYVYLARPFGLVACSHSSTQTVIRYVRSWHRVDNLNGMKVCFERGAEVRNGAYHYRGVIVNRGGVSLINDPGDAKIILSDSNLFTRPKDLILKNLRYKPSKHTAYYHDDRGTASKRLNYLDN